MDDVGFYTICHPEYYEILSRFPVQSTYLDVLRAVLPPDWSIARSDIWLQAKSQSAPLETQGFKIHLSCTLPDAETMIRRFVPICTSADVQFKIVADPTLHGFLNSKRYYRGGSGKFATIYPPNENAFRELSETLHQTTKGLEGPYILSDKRYPGSKTVFYRWGGFQRVLELRPDGIRRMMAYAPDGTRVPDDRLPYFKLPDWVTDPFPGDPEPEGEDDLLHDRYKVEKALAFTNTGGVYRARDQVTGLAVVVKEARPHTLIWGATKITIDAIIALRNECAILQRLQGLSSVPQFVDFYQEWEHTFLVQSYFDGISLANFRATDEFVIMSKMEDREAMIRFSKMWREIGIRLLDAVEAIHERGVIIGDISPGNVLINPETGEIVLIDFESALSAEGEQEITRLGTHWFNPGFRKPASRTAGALSHFDDFYSCGMLLYNLVCPIQSLFELDKDQPVFRILDHFVDAGLPLQVRAIIQILLEGNPAKAREELEAWGLPDATPAEPPFRRITALSADESRNQAIQGYD